MIGLWYLSKCFYHCVGVVAFSKINKLRLNFRLGSSQAYPMGCLYSQVWQKHNCYSQEDEYQFKIKKALFNKGW